MAGLVKAPLVTDTMPPTGARDGGWLAGLRTTPGRLRAGVALVMLLACGLGPLTGVVFAALDSGPATGGCHRRGRPGRPASGKFRARRARPLRGTGRGRDRGEPARPRPCGPSVRGDAELLPAGHRLDEHDRAAGRCVAYHGQCERL